MTWSWFLERQDLYREQWVSREYRILLFLLKSGDSQTTVIEQTVHFLTASLCHRVGFYFMALQLCYCNVFKTQFEIQILIVTLIYWQVLPSSRLRAFRSSLLLTQSGLLSHNSWVTNRPFIIMKCPWNWFDGRFFHLPLFGANILDECIKNQHANKTYHHVSENLFSFIPVYFLRSRLFYP